MIPPLHAVGYGRPEKGSCSLRDELLTEAGLGDLVPEILFREFEYELMGQGEVAVDALFQIPHVPGVEVGLEGMAGAPGWHGPEGGGGPDLLPDPLGGPEEE